MSKLGYGLVALFCYIVWICIVISFTFGLVETTSENMFRVFIGGLVTAYMIYNANKLYEVGKLL